MPLRGATEADFGAVSDLLAQLGYAVDEHETKMRLQQVLGSSEHHVWLSEEDGDPDGLIHFFVRSSLEKGREVIVQALVVSPAARRTGVGHKLMQKAEELAQSKGCGSISLYTNISRDDALKFYMQLGYVRQASSNLMKKSVGH